MLVRLGCEFSHNFHTPLSFHLREQNATWFDHVLGLMILSCLFANATHQI